MITEDDKTAIHNIARKYNAKKVILFGSNCYPSADSSDIDLAVDGVNDLQFFEFYSELIFSFSKPVDLIDLKVKSKFSDIAASEGLSFVWLI